MSTISVDRLTKQYKGGVIALDGVTFDVNAGEVFGFLGPNGAGKSTAIKILTTLLKPTSGRAEILGMDVGKHPALVRRAIGYSSQEVGLDESATGWENLVLYGHFYRLDGKTIRQRASDLLELMDLTRDAKRQVATYSGGMRKRLDLATALLHQPKVLILDEPTVGLDPQSRSHIASHIKGLGAQLGITVFFTTHYMDEADKLAHRIAIIDQGKIITIGTPLDLKKGVSGDLVSVTLAVPSEALGDVALDKGRELLLEQLYVKDIQTVDSALYIYVESAETDLPRILKVMDSNDLPVQTVTLSRPTLDDVFIQHTGRTMRDEEGQRTTWAQMQRGRRRRG